MLVLNVELIPVAHGHFQVPHQCGRREIFCGCDAAGALCQMKIAYQRDPENGLDLSMLNMANAAPVFTKKKKKVA